MVRVLGEALSVKWTKHALGLHREVVLDSSLDDLVRYRVWVRTQLCNFTMRMCAWTLPPLIEDNYT